MKDIIRIKKSHLRLALVSVGLLALVLLIGFLMKGLDFYKDSQENLPSDFVKVGEFGVLYAEGSDVVILAITKDALKELIKTATEGNQESYSKIFSEGKAVIVPIATKAEVMEIDSSFVKVRLLDGEYVGGFGWVPSEWIIK